CSSYAGSNVFF
nr:immunoglobulin light chain junction region [Macaca mulatta]MPO03269.1 immunoglobulin light chain junction region [Macaca mulatta]MPO03872.1 immunoglobulin light chain junction region [Macaca mulatta]MPO04183.1 immunoglobulin light chain junction region [Macaca mulatta]MPO04351.1 immunoglobulin light chain junction region [Macaca mulatta]